jgi:hypothetical protein
MAKNTNDLLPALLEDMASTGEIATGKKKKFTFVSGSDIKKKEPETIEKAISSVFNPANGIERLAYTVNPDRQDFSGLYVQKLKLLPNYLLKRITVQDNLVASILLARGNQMMAYGRPQPKRSDTGYKIEISATHQALLTDAEKIAWRKRISEVERKMMTCGNTEGIPDGKVPSFVEFLFTQARDAMTYGWCATEIIYSYGFKGKVFKAFRPLDAGTIYRANRMTDAQTKLETQKRLKKIQADTLKKSETFNIDLKAVQNDEYAWYQVIGDTPKIAFKDDECVVHNFYPSNDVDLMGYPITPIDTVIGSITTHLNIATHNKLFFQSGRAARGMIVIQSDDVDENSIADIRQHFTSNINSVQNSWRLPVFKVSPGEAVTWQPMDMSARDGEFQYLADMNCREIMAAFMISPEELTAYSYLSHGTNSQTFAESSNEFRLTAARDLGIRPMLAGFQNFINSRILPIMDPELSKIASFKFLGLEAEPADKESQRFAQDMSVYMTMDDVLEKVEKQPVGKRFGGSFLLNKSWHEQLDKYVFVGEIMEHFFDKLGASWDPKFQYLRDQYFFQWQTMQAAKAQPGGGGEAMDFGKEPGQEGEKEEGKLSAADAAAIRTLADQGMSGKDIAARFGVSTPYVYNVLHADEVGLKFADSGSDDVQKSEHQIVTRHKKLLKKQDNIVKNALEGFKKDSEEAFKELLDTASLHLKS